jgi:Nucleotidyl transferase AbiEii toxin, Type IV TA system
MLHTETVEPGTLSLLKKLMTLQSLQPFSLVGGTALSLQYGHRSSVNLDLFFHEKFDHTIIEKELSLVFGNEFDYESGHKNIGIFCYIKKSKLILFTFHILLLQLLRRRIK